MNRSRVAALLAPPTDRSVRTNARLQLRSLRANEEDMVLIELRKKMGNPPFLLLDIRPAGYPFLAIFDHAIAEQITSSSKALPNSVQKSATFKDFRDILGPSSIVGIDGEHWKSLRKRFNPCFAPHHLMTLLPLILDKTRIFINQMDKFAISGEQFELGDYCTRLTFDIIGKNHPQLATWIGLTQN